MSALTIYTSRFRALICQCGKKMDGLVFTFDLEREDTLLDFGVWLSLLGESCALKKTTLNISQEDGGESAEVTPVMILANKADAFERHSPTTKHPIEDGLADVTVHKRGMKFAKVCGRYTHHSAEKNYHVFK